MIIVACRKSLRRATLSSPCKLLALRSTARSSSLSSDSLHSDVFGTHLNPTVNYSEYVDIREGKAFMSHAKDKAVFYNKVQTFNRDMSILAVRLFAEVRKKELLEQYHDKLKRFHG